MKNIHYVWFESEVVDGIESYKATNIGRDDVYLCVDGARRGWFSTSLKDASSFTIAISVLNGCLNDDSCMIYRIGGVFYVKAKNLNTPKRVEFTRGTSSYLETIMEDNYFYSAKLIRLVKRKAKRTFNFLRAIELRITCENESEEIEVTKELVTIMHEAIDRMEDRYSGVTASMEYPTVKPQDMEEGIDYLNGVGDSEKFFRLGDNEDE